jgi:hypothetical protein
MAVLKVDSSAAIANVTNLWISLIFFAMISPRRRAAPKSSKVTGVSIHPWLQTFTVLIFPNPQGADFIVRFFETPLSPRPSSGKSLTPRLSNFSQHGSQMTMPP